MNDLRKVLVYERKTFYRLLMVEILEKEGYEVFSEETLKGVISTLYKESPDVFLVDLSELKERDTDFLMAVKKSFPTLPIITLVDAENKELVVRYLRAGVFDCISKPIIKEELLISVKNAIEFSQFRRGSNLPIDRLKRLAFGSEKILEILNERHIKVPLLHPGERLVQSILDAMSLVLEAEKVSLSWLDREKKTYQVIATAGHNVKNISFKPRKLGEGIVGYVALHKEPIHVVDIAKDKRFTASPFKEQYKSGSFLCGPILLSDEVIAVLSVSDKKDGNIFSEEDFLLFKTFLLQVTYAIESSLMIKTLEIHNQKLAIYKKIAEHIVNLVEGGDIIKNILKTLVEYFNGEGASLFIIDENKEFFVNEGAVGLPFKERVPFMPSSEVLLTQIFTKENKEVERLISQFISFPALTNFCSAPIKLKNFPLGFLLIANNAIEPEDKTILEDISSLVSIAFKNNWLYKNLCLITEELVRANRELEELNKKI